jgi:tRNA pseudouridine38-40 synthase
VQGTLAVALRSLMGDGVRVVGASRTDAGVHALGQVASVSGGRWLPPAVVQTALNATLPADVRVLAAREAPPGFDARRAARLKRYAYLLATGPVAAPGWRAHAWHRREGLDQGAMQAALPALRGRHDFSAFCAAAGRDRTPVTTVRSLRLMRSPDLLVVLVSADAFLHHMVRNLVGTLVEIGRGRQAPAWAADVLAGRDRRRAGPTAPAAGMWLVRVRYTPALFPGRLSPARRIPRRGC